jgi:dTDP-4-amino-4,6-dideoxygalactose transaminase
MTIEQVPFNVPTLEGRELEHVEAAIRSGRTSSGGPMSQRAGEILREETGAAGVLLTTSCTAALELSAMLLDIGPGDTVIVPSFTFVTTALAFARQGARILFCDIEPDTLAADPKHVAALLDDSVKAVVLVHYAGVAGDVDGLTEVLSARPDVALVEDAAHALFGAWRGRPLGSLGRFASLSFHETKNIVCGEGGALLVNDPDDLARASVLYDKGTNRRAFLEGHVDKYSWRDTGSSFGLSDTLAGHLLGQLEARETIQAKRRRVHERYVELLAEPCAELGVRLPVVPEASDPAYHLFHLLLPDAATRGPVMREMNEAGVQVTFHYVPLHDSEGGRRFSARPTECPVTSDVSSRLLRLPFHNDLSDAEAERVADVLLAALRRHTA